MELLREIRASNILRHVQRFSDIGPRPDGSPPDLEAVEYIAEQMRLSGLHIELFPVSVPVIDSLETELHVTSPTTKPIRCLPNMRPGLTPSEGIIRPLVFAGKGFGSDFSNIDCTDKIVLCFEEQPWEGESPSRPGYAHERTQNAKRAGAAGVIMSDKRDDELITTWGLTRNLDDLPSVCISYPDFLELRRACTTGPVEVWLKVYGEVRAGHSDLVIGTLPGDELADRLLIIVGSHHETNHGVPGANDNGSGLAVMLELARFFRQHSLKRTLLFISTGGEESGHWGNAEWVNANLQWLKAKADAVIVLVAIGVPNVAVYGTKWNGMATDKSLNRVITGCASELGYVLPIWEHVPFLSDATEYLEQGIPAAVLCSGRWDRFVHTAEDIADNVSPNHLKTIADTVAYAIMQLDQPTT